MTWPTDLFAGGRFAVLGLGRNGLPAAAALAAMGAEVVAWDDGAADRAALPAGVRAAPLGDAADDMAGRDALVISPGIGDHHAAAAAARAAGVPVLSDAELLFQAVRRAGGRARFAGITGTNGKSTTTALLAHILDRAGVPVAAGGNLGPAALALPLLPDDGVYVLEMSSYMLDRLATLRFDAAVLLNLSPDHLDRHGGMAGYAAAKRHVFDRQTGADLALFGAENPAPLAGYPALRGGHNAQNALAASAMARHLGVAEDAIEAGLRGFPGLPHRQKPVAVAGRVTFVDDSKATNADAASRALGCHDRVVWIAGGIAKGGGIDALRPFFPRIAQALLIGRDAPTLAAGLAGAGVPHRVVGTLDRAVPAAFDAARALGVDTVLLSPACASFDQFPHYEARGLAFAALARALPGAEAVS